MWDTVQSITAPFPFLSGNSNFLVVEKVLFTYFILSSSSVCIEPQYWCWVLSTQLKLVVPEVGMQLSLHLSESFLRVKTKQKNKAKKKSTGSVKKIPLLLVIKGIWNMGHVDTCFQTHGRNQSQRMKSTSRKWQRQEIRSSFGYNYIKSILALVSWRSWFSFTCKTKAKRKNRNH